jgi:hypothetical protein
MQIQLPNHWLATLVAHPLRANVPAVLRKPPFRHLFTTHTGDLLMYTLAINLKPSLYSLVAFMLLICCPAHHQSVTAVFLDMLFQKPPLAGKLASSLSVRAVCFQIAD